MMTLLRHTLLSIVLVLVAASCGNDSATSADLEFSNMWSRQPVDGQSTAAVYGTVTNRAGSDVRIIAASVDVTETVELHLTVMEDGLMTMKEQPDGFVVPARSSYTLEPGGAHIMLRGIDPASYPTDAIDVTLSFDAGDPAFVTAQVRSIDGSDMGDEMDHDEMDHDEMDHDDE